MMNRSLRRLFAVCFIIVSLSYGIFSNIFAGNLYIQDRVGILTASEISELNELVSDHDRATTVQLVGAVVPSLEGMSVMDHGTRLANNLGVGQKSVNNGGLILLAPKERQVGIITGYGLEWAITDRQAQAIIEAMTPFLKKGEYCTALRLGFDRMIALTKNISWQVVKGNISALSNKDIGNIYRFEAQIVEKQVSKNQLGINYYMLRMSTIDSDEIIIVNATIHMQGLIDKLEGGGSCWITARLRGLSPLSFDLLGVE